MKKSFNDQQSTGTKISAATKLYPGATANQNYDELHDAEKLIIYYIMNLFIFQEIENATSLIQNYALRIKGSTLFEANIQRILGLLLLKKDEVDDSLAAFKEALNLYSQ